MEDLSRRVEKLNAEFKKVFPKQTEEEKRLFTKLQKAYIDSRYKMGYEITKDELKYLSERVKILQELTKGVCKEKLQQFEEECKKKDKRPLTQ